MSEPSEPARRGMPRADFVTGLVIALLGVAVVWVSLDMPRFADRNVNPYTAPGLVPGALGIIILGLGVVLFGRAVLAGGWQLGGLRLGAGPDVRRLLLALVLCLGYAAGLVGTIPFWLATFVFVALFVMLFEWRSASPWPWRVGIALVYGAAISVAVTLVFQKIFLIRLP